MKITIIAIGKKHSRELEPLIAGYQKRLKKPFDLDWLFLPHSNLAGDLARGEESQRILARLASQDFVILLDERGKNLSSPELAQIFQRNFTISRRIVLIIGGAFGVSDELRARADLVWSLSRLVFPHQIVRLILIEQLYRAQEILAGGKYHHQ